MPWRRAIAIAAIVAACYLVATSSDRPPKVVIETNDLSPDELLMRVPSTVSAGLVEIELRNNGDMLHDAQLFRIDGDRTAGDVVSALEQSDNEPKPRWLHPTGGVAPTAPGETATVTQVLQPGTYYVADTQERKTASGGHLTNAAKRGIARIEVRGETGDELPDAAATITAREYEFDAERVEAGTNSVTFRNAGREFHQVAAFPIPAGVSWRAGRRAVLRRWGDTGWVPVAVPDEHATTVFEGGGEQVVEMTFEPGRYLLLCFVSDWTGGSPQWMSGMESRMTVRATGLGEW